MISGSRNTLIGYQAALPDSTASDQIVIGSGAAKTYLGGPSAVSCTSSELLLNGGTTLLAYGGTTLSGPLNIYNNSGTPNYVLSYTSATTSPQWVSQIAGTSTVSGYTDKFTNIGYGAAPISVAAIPGVAVGYNALTHLTTGIDNVAVGYLAGHTVSTGSGNTIIGTSAGAALTTGKFNTIVGSNAGATVSGNNNIIIGHNADIKIPGVDNQIVLGTASGTIFVQRGFNTSIYPDIISTSVSLTTPLSQCYIVSADNNTITLPNPTSSITGAAPLFRRRDNAPKTITFTTPSGAARIANIYHLDNTNSLQTSIQIGQNTFVIQFLCNSEYWYQLY